MIHQKDPLSTASPGASSESLTSSRCPTAPATDDSTHLSDSSPPLLALLNEIAFAPAVDPNSIPIPGECWGAGERYKIKTLLGSGGMGSVYESIDTLLGRRVALKVLRPGHGTDRAVLRATVIREARLAATVEHERIARVYDVGEHEGITFLALEFVPGETLRTLLLRGNLSYQDAASITLQIAEGLSALHSHGIVHGDLKPENIMVSAPGQVKLLDFGLARSAAAAALSSNRAGSVTGPLEQGVAGTPRYMSPERWLGRCADTRTDVYAMGVILSEMTMAVGPCGHEAGLCKSEMLQRLLAPKPEERLADGDAVLAALRTQNSPTVGTDRALSRVDEKLEGQLGVPRPMRFRRHMNAAGAVLCAAFLGPTPPAEALSGSIPPGLISNFEDGTTAPNRGGNWHAVTDRIQNGASTAELSLTDEGANGSRGALHVEGEIVSEELPRDSEDVWAGVVYRFPNGSADISNLHELVFHARGDRGLYRVILFGVHECSRMRCRGPSVLFRGSRTWVDIRVPLDSFAGVDFEKVFSIHFGATGPGQFFLDLDDVELR